jgi:hypothetical protein
VPVMTEIEIPELHYNPVEDPPEWAFEHWRLERAYGIGRTPGEAIYRALCAAALLSPDRNVKTALAEHLGMSRQGLYAMIGTTRTEEVRRSYNKTVSQVATWANELGLLLLTRPDGGWLVAHPSLVTVRVPRGGLTDGR